jgi:serine phosphatase RsbU (regulator of sigma subunit)
VYLQNHDIIYFASDGFADQNNEERVKFGSKNLKELIKDSTNKPLAEQKNIFLKALNKHQNRSEQRDDIALVALKVHSTV